MLHVARSAGEEFHGNDRALSVVRRPNRDTTSPPAKQSHTAKSSDAQSDFYIKTLLYLPDYRLESTYISEMRKECVISLCVGLAG